MEPVEIKQSGADNSDTGRIKVLVIAPSFDLIGGQSAQAERLVGALGQSAEVEVGFQPINPRFFPALQRVKYLRTVLTSIKYVFDLFIKTPHYDVIHIFSASYFSFVLAPTPAVLIAKLFGKKALLNYHSGEAEDHLQRWGKTAIPTIRLFNDIIVPSGYLVDIFGEFGLKAHSIFNFVDTDKFSFRDRDRLRPIFLSNRSFEELYNIPCTIKAFALIQKEHPEAQLLLAGDGSKREKIKELVEELKLNNVNFMGKIPQSEMPELYAKADIYLSSSNIDNMPVSIIESFASGLPVISTNAGGIPYILEHGETGLLVEKDDHEGMANEAKRLLIDHKLAQKIITQARQDCVKYSWDKVYSAWLDTYRRLVTP